MSINEIHTDMMQLHQSLNLNRKGNVKTCVLTYPSDARNSKYKSKQFIVQCNTSRSAIKKMKTLDSDLTSGAIMITLIFEDLEGTVAQGSSGTPARLSNFKNDMNSVFLK